jgi:hypothetical protein
MRRGAVSRYLAERVQTQDLRFARKGEVFFFFLRRACATLCELWFRVGLLLVPSRGGFHCPCHRAPSPFFSSPQFYAADRATTNLSKRQAPTSLSPRCPLLCFARSTGWFPSLLMTITTHDPCSHRMADWETWVDAGKRK